MNDEFEELLQRQQNPNIDNKYTKKVFSTNNTKKCVIQKSDKGASLFDFIKMLDKIITLSMKNVSFVPDEGKTLALDSMKNMDKPLITYKVNKREIKDELKPRVRQEIEELDENNEKRTGDVYGQRFKCEIQFNIFDLLTLKSPKTRPIINAKISDNKVNNKVCPSDCNSNPLYVCIIEIIGFPRF